MTPPGGRKSGEHLVDGAEVLDRYEEAVEHGVLFGAASTIARMFHERFGMSTHSFRPRIRDLRSGEMQSSVFVERLNEVLADFEQDPEGYIEQYRLRHGEKQAERRRQAKAKRRGRPRVDEKFRLVPHPEWPVPKDPRSPRRCKSCTEKLPKSGGGEGARAGLCEDCWGQIPPLLAKSGRLVFGARPDLSVSDDDLHMEALQHGLYAEGVVPPAPPPPAFPRPPHLRKRGAA